MLLLGLVCNDHFLDSSHTAFGFPSNIRYGYNACVTCHTSPTGGGVVTKYGKVAAEEFMSTWAEEGEAQVFYGLLDMPEWLDIGGDVRQVEYKLKSESDGSEFHTKFLMQADIEAALHFSNHVSFVTSGGKYGQDRSWQRRRSYLLTHISDNQSFRLGRFFPGYGIMVDDHTKLFRRSLGFEQGQETYNMEYVLRSEDGEIFLTRVFGRETSFETDIGGRIEHKTLDEEGVTTKATAFISKRFQMGLSYLKYSNSTGSRDAYGWHSLLATSKKNYFFLQSDRLRSKYGVNDQFFFRWGYVPFQGFHTKFETEIQKDIDMKVYTIALQWFPIPHWEFLAEWDVTHQDGNRLDSSLVMVHYYF